MIKFRQPEREYSVSEMIYHLRNPKGKRSLSELDVVVDEILQRNPEFVEEINKILTKEI